MTASLRVPLFHELRNLRVRGFQHRFLRQEDDAEKALKAFSDLPQNQGKPAPLLMLAEFYNRTNEPNHAQMLLQQASLAKQQDKIAHLQDFINRFDEHSAKRRTKRRHTRARKRIRATDLVEAESVE